MSGFYGANVIASYTVVAVIYIALDFTHLAELAGAPAAAKKWTGAVLSADDVDADARGTERRLKPPGSLGLTRAAGQRRRPWHDRHGLRRA
ncbi:hypothetical protein SVIOM342S_07988 [Streptomyces violaceorubidus]